MVIQIVSTFWLSVVSEVFQREIGITAKKEKWIYLKVGRWNTLLSGLSPLLLLYRSQSDNLEIRVHTFVEFEAIILLQKLWLLITASSTPLLCKQIILTGNSEQFCSDQKIHYHQVWLYLHFLQVWYVRWNQLRNHNIVLL